MAISHKRIISTWLYLEGVGENGIYPQVPGNSSTANFHDIYKRCLITFFASARASNQSADLILFTNIDLSVSQRDFDRRILILLKRFQVSIIVLEYTFTPPEEQKMWRNQFFVLNVLEYFTNNSNPNDLCMILDSDVIWSGSFSTKRLWNDLEHYGSLIMLPISDRNEKINGLSSIELEREATLMGVPFPPQQYAGGEFIALRGDKLRQVYQLSKILWDKYKARVATRETNFMEEAHFLSMVYATLEFPFGNGDKYIRRIWTQVFHYSNRENSDLDLALWHLPAEKRFGIRRIANLYILGDCQKWPAPESADWKRLTYKLGLIKGLNSKVILDIFKSIKDRIWK